MHEQPGRVETEHGEDTELLRRILAEVRMIRLVVVVALGGLAGLAFVLFVANVVRELVESS